MNDNKIGEVNLDCPIRLRMTGNGGWVVYQSSESGENPSEVGAYTTAKEMIEALRSCLVWERANAVE